MPHTVRPSFRNLSRASWVARGCAWWLPIVMLVAGGEEARAHQLNLFVNVQGRNLQGEAYYRGRIPARQSKVAVFAPDGSRLAEAATDDQGHFTIPLRWRCDHRVQLDAGEGHGQETVVPAADLPQDLPAWKQENRGESVGASRAKEDGVSKPIASTFPVTSEPPGIGAQLDDVNRQLVAMRRELDALKHGLRWQDITGALGYLLGLTGLSFYFLGVRRRHARENARGVE